MTLDELKEHLKTSPHWFVANYNRFVLRELVSAPEYSDGHGHRFRGRFAGRTARVRLLFSLRKDIPFRSNWVLVPYHEALALRMQGWTMYTRAYTAEESETCQTLERSRSP